MFPTVLDIRDGRVPYISSATFSSQSSLSTGDVVIADTAEDYTAGKALEVVVSEEINVVPGLHTIACHPKVFFAPGFLGYYLNSSAYKERLRPLIQGIKVYSISKSSLATTSISFPSYDEQYKIGLFLSIIDRRIAVQNKIIEDLECLRNGLVHLLNNDGTCETKTIGEVFEISKEKLGSNMDMPVFTASAKNGLVDEETYFKKKISGADKTNYQIIRKGDFVYSKSSSKDAPFGALIKFTGVIGLVSPLYWVLKPKKLINEGALEAWFSSSYASSQFQRKCQEGARNHGMLNIALADFLSIRLWVDIPARIKNARHLLKKKIDRENKLLNAYQKEKTFLLNAMFI